MEEKNKIRNGDLFLNLVAKRLCISPRNNNSSGKPVNKKIPKSPKFKIKVYQLVSRILLQNHDFEATKC